MKHLYTLLIMLGLFTFSKVNAQEADFTYTSTTGNTFCDPQRVTFRQTSTGNPVSFVWHFGNGQTGNQPVEEVTYLNPGTYTVKLIAIYNNVAVTKEKTITINSTPTVTLSANKRNLCTPGTVQFTASSSVDAVSYQWTFGDGSSVVTTSNRTISHQFTEFGTYNVQVKVLNAQGCSESSSTTIDISPLTLSGDVDKTFGCLPATTQFNVNVNYLSGDAPASMVWNFGDGQTSSQITNELSHNYTTSASVRPTVTVRTQNGCEASFEFSELAFGNAPTSPTISTVTGESSYCGSEEVSMLAQADGANYYVWHYGDNSSDSTNRNLVKHKFKTLGVMPVKVTPYHNGCAGEVDSLHIEIIGVIARFDVKNTCDAKNVFTFTNRTLGNISTSTWNYGGNLTNDVQESSLHGSFTYPLVSSSFAELVVTDNITGCADTLKRNIFTAQPYFDVDRFSVCKDSSITFMVKEDYPAEANIKYNFHINDLVLRGRTSNTYTYEPNVHGIFENFVVLSDQYTGTCNDTLYLREPVKVKGPVVSFDSPAFVCFDSTLELSNNSYPYFADEPISQWEWKAGQTVLSNDEHPAPVSFTSPGTYPIRLTVTDVNGCAQLMTKSLLVKRLPKIDILPRVDTICANTPIELIAYTSDQVNWLNIPAGACITCDTVVVRPTESITYMASAIDQYGCKNYTNSVIEVVTPQTLQVSPMDTTICEGKGFQLQVQSPGEVQFFPAQYLTDPNSHNPYVFPESSIQYTVAVTDPRGCFTDSVRVNVRVRENPSLEAGPDLRLNYGEAFTIRPNAVGAGLQYEWTSSNQTVNCPTCSFYNSIANDNETIEVKITDSWGCESTDKVYVKIDCQSKQLLVPNAFTPNGDGLNDYFYPMAKGFNELKQFTIYNRNGVKVFEKKNMPTNEPSQGWNGKINGTKPSTQTFVWIAQMECDGEIITRKGTVTLIR